MLGAVALLAIVYSTLATVAIRGVRSEGESRRMMEASLRADWEQAELELQIEGGEVPELGTRESEEDEDGFIETWEVTPFTPQFDGASPADLDGTSPADLFPEESKNSDGGGLAELFEFSDDSAPPFLQILLTISWLDGGTPHSVTRTTYMVDEAVASKQIELKAERATEGLQP